VVDQQGPRLGASSDDGKSKIWGKEPLPLILNKRNHIGGAAGEEWTLTLKYSARPFEDAGKMEKGEQAGLG
jgi:hypothetical protein